MYLIFLYFLFWTALIALEVNFEFFEKYQELDQGDQDLREQTKSLFIHLSPLQLMNFLA